MIAAMRIPLILGLCLLAPPAVAGPFARWSEGRTYLGFILGSDHIARSGGSAAGFNDHTGGLTLGRRWPVGQVPGQEFSLEGGVFYNSYRETGPIAIFGYSARAADLGRAGELRIGAFAGTAYYPSLSKSLRSHYGVPSIGGMVPMIGLSGSWRLGPSELRLTAVPPGDLAAVVNLSWSLAF